MAFSSRAETLFVCSAETVWSVLCSEECYSGWYGWPEPSILESISPNFSAGAKLTFYGAESSTILTAMEQGTRLVLSSGMHTTEIRVESRGEDSCFVSLIYTATDPAGESHPAETMLKRLKEVCYGRILPYLSMTAPPPHSTVRTFLRRSRNPVASNHRSTATRHDTFLDHTESDVNIYPRSGFLSLLLSIFFFAVLLFTFSFERSDVIPSSGLSVMESDHVNRYRAEQIFAGQGKNELELMLSCRGMRLTTNEYYYCSDDHDVTGEAQEQILVSYDAYGKVRSYAYVATEQRDKRLELEFWDFKSVLNSDMSFSAVELAIGEPLSAFRVDRSGRKTICFGMLDPYEDIFSRELRSELVVTLDPEAHTVSVDFYPPYDRRTPLPDAETERLARQYRNFDHYLADRNAYELIQLLLGRRQHEVDVVLGAGDYSKEEDGTTQGFYTLLSPSDQSIRHEYFIRFDENGVAQEITYTNRYLFALTGTLSPPGEYELYRGMSLTEVYHNMQILPIAAQFSDDKIVLCFGDHLSDESIEACATITIEATSDTRMVTELHYNGQKTQEDPNNAQQTD